MTVDGVELRYTPVRETRDAVDRRRTTRTRYERVRPDGRERVERDWVLHWHTPESFVRLCRPAGLAVETLVDDDTGEPATARSTSFTALLRRA